jgi:hypothetical protein
LVRTGFEPPAQQAAVASLLRFLLRIVTSRLDLIPG